MATSKPTSEADLHFLVGADLMDVVVSLHDVILRFDHDVRVGAYSSVRVTDANERFIEFTNFVVGGHSLLPLLRCTVVKMALNDDGLHLTFSNATEVVLLRDADGFESFMVFRLDQIFGG